MKERILDWERRKRGRKACFTRWSACSSPARIRVFGRPSKNWAGVLWALFWVTQIVVYIVVIHTIPFLDCVNVGL
ncbi:hypothetical protein RHMOL_Rhmol13G0130300 [Rhododendron molle]|uniref:Uncharacterized protein n=1 Tax=Rhododendron molle TaxID=49168 RepID=A0ACC0L633_RHOML|nr:hypothetical protein RHMOL_Rhmol13G0130300 [Rhododendron molle]